MLTLFEELYLLALDDDHGNILPYVKKTYSYGLAGAVLAELVFQNRIKLGEKHRLILKNTELTGDEVLDEAIHELHASDKAHKPSYWISQFNLKPKKQREQLGVRLAGKGYLHQEDKRFFWIFNEGEEDHPMAPQKYELKSVLRAKILSTEAKDARNLALLKIIAASGLLELVFTRDELPLAARAINEQMIRAALENPALQTIEEIGQGVATCLEDELD